MSAAIQVPATSAAATLEVRRWSRGAGDVKPFTMDDIGNMSFPQ